MYYIWLWFGTKILGWPFIDIYSADKENVTAITFSRSEEYIDKVMEIE